MSKLNAQVTSLPDYIDTRLRILSVGLNPSVPSAAMGYYFANPRNRFWRAFICASIVDEKFIVDATVHHWLLREHAIGFTDVVKRPTRMGNQLRAADFKRDAPALREKIEVYQPAIVWIHGKVAMRQFMQYAYGIKQAWQWGFNEVKALKADVYVTPNPSPANAAFSLANLVEWYQPLADR